MKLSLTSFFLVTAFLLLASRSLACDGGPYIDGPSSILMNHGNPNNPEYSASTFSVKRIHGNPSYQGYYVEWTFALIPHAWEVPKKTWINYELFNWDKQTADYLITARIYYTNTDGSIYDQKTVTKSVLVTNYGSNRAMYAGESSISGNNSLLIYPNPTSGVIKLQSIKFVEVYDVSGNLIKKYGEEEEMIDLSEHPSGVYFFKGKTIDGVKFSERILKN